MSLAGAREVYGSPIARDDLKLVEGVGPGIEQLLRGGGIKTWASLANARVDELRATLDGGGARFRMHDPSTWPMQAHLLANGRWSEHKTLTDTLRAGRTADPRPSRPPAPDLGRAAQVLGRDVDMDDLKIVEGIGPKIEQLCHADGITTWWDLAQVDAAKLTAILDKAGPRYQMHDPATWPQQGELLARGMWEAFVALTDRLKGGRAR